MSSPIDVSVVLPIYNNASTLPNLVKLLCQALDQMQFELVLVNDASPDHSAQELDRLADMYPNLVVITHPQNQGQNRAIMTGLAKAKGNKVVVMDADLQDRPEALPGLIAAQKQPGQAVFIKRQGQYQAAGRMVTSRLYKKLLQAITGLHHQAGSFFVIPRDLVTEVQQIPITHPTITVMVATVAKQIDYLPGPRWHNDGQSNYTFRKRLAYARKAFLCVRECKRWQRKTKVAAPAATVPAE